MKRSAVLALVVAAAVPFLACGGQQPNAHTLASIDVESPPVSATTLPSSPASSTSAEAPSAGTTTASGTTPPDPRTRPARIAARHILIQWMGCRQAGPEIVRTREHARAVVDEVLKRARSGQDFPRLATEYSDEPGAGRRGGALPRFGHGEMDKQFEIAAFALEVGGISDVVETPFGFHIIQRTE